MQYEKPLIVDYGSIGEHTFAGPGPPRKDTRLCTKDNFQEESCPTP
jgi:hypothetical protein